MQLFRKRTNAAAYHSEEALLCDLVFQRQCGQLFCLKTLLVLQPEKQTEIQ